MQTINTILSQSDQLLLEGALLNFGRVVTFDQLVSLMITSTTRGYARKKIALLVKKGWLVRLKNGLYVVITDISVLGSNDLSEYVIAGALHKESYISFENALQYHDLFDQALNTVRSVTKNYARNHTVQQTAYIFSKTKTELYFGFSEEVISSSYRVNIAEAEKALLDILYFRTSAYDVSIVLEKLKEHAYKLDTNKLQQYAERYGIAVARLVGFLLDQIDADTSELLTYTKSHKGSYNRLSAKSDQFNAKWRLYYEDYIIA